MNRSGIDRAFAQVNADKMNKAFADLRSIRQFLPASEMSVIRSSMTGEERVYFFDLVNDMADRIANMPETYQTDGQGDEATVWLHYFNSSMDWYITEKDGDPDGEGQLQAFGYANLGDPYCAELGYISIKELTENGVELDLYWSPKPLKLVKAAMEVHND